MTAPRVHRGQVCGGDVLGLAFLCASVFLELFLGSFTADFVRGVRLGEGEQGG
ncbi:MAG: hypothetical protein R3B67_02425 [Phycisphaerales bacterium]